MTAQQEAKYVEFRHPTRPIRTIFPRSPCNIIIRHLIEMAKTLLFGILSSFALAAPLNLSSTLAPLVENQNAIQGEYMITFKDGHSMKNSSAVYSVLQCTHTGTR